VLQRGFEDLVCAGVAFAPVTGQSVDRGDPDLGIGIVGHGDELAHGVCVDRVVEETAAALADGWIVVMQASTDRAHRVFCAHSWDLLRHLSVTEVLEPFVQVEHAWVQPDSEEYRGLRFWL
jgi:hypothetical protein